MSASQQQPDRSWLEQPAVSYGAWRACVEERRDVVDPIAVLNLHQLLDRPGEPPEALPILWHLVAFREQGAHAELSPDGHPRTGTFLPPMSGRQRMFAGSRIHRAGALLVGDGLHRVSRVVDVEVKNGRAGELVFVTVRHFITGPNGWVQQDDSLVYREPIALQIPARSPDPADPWRLTYRIDPALLFRYSAITYNAHRIHYDRDYARVVAGYPGLVVHGPLQATFLADLAGRHLADEAIDDFTFKATAPAFDTADFEAAARPSAGGVALTGRSDDVITMQATAHVTDHA